MKWSKLVQGWSKHAMNLIAKNGVDTGVVRVVQVGRAFLRIRHGGGVQVRVLKKEAVI